MTYSDLVKEAFIDPIRSVLIVDDEYPTWDKMLSDVGVAAEPADWDRIRSTAKKTIQSFRNHSPSMIVDVHDGGALDTQEMGVETADQVAAHMFQSDMLVLDYQLEGEEGGGFRSIGLARKVLQNRHFNMIVVHTAKELAEPFENFVLSLLSVEKEFPARLIEGGEKVFEKLVEESEENDPDIILQDFTAVLNNQHFLRCYQLSKDQKLPIKELQQGKGIFSAFVVKAKKYKLSQIDTLNLGVFLLHSLQRKLVGENFSDVPFGDLSWRDARIAGDELFWIRTSRGFITFARKTATQDLVEVLQKALECWGATPSRLLSTKLRAELESQGVAAEDNVLNRRAVFKRFYQYMKSLKTDDERRAALKSQIDRYIENLSDQTAESVVEFGLNILEADKDNSFIEHYGFSDADKNLELEYNHYISSKPLSGWHLSPGHIFSLSQDANKTYWVCLSPACDMVPGQRKVGMEFVAPKTEQREEYEKSPTAKALMAVKLHPYKSDLSKEQINSNEFVFIKEPTGTKVFNIYPNTTGDKAKEPIWCTFFAANGGAWEYEGDKIQQKLNLQWVRHEHDVGISMATEEAVVHGHLRYEYALNLNQKLGSNLTRVGLDYLTSSKSEEKAK